MPAAVASITALVTEPPKLQRGSLKAPLSPTCAGMAAIASVVGWHIWRVVGHRRWQDAAAYIWSRTLLFAFFAGSALVLRRQRGVDFHLHHLYLGACWVGAGRFVPGCSMPTVW